MAGRNHRPPADWSVYLVTDSRLCAELGVPATAAAAVRGGATAVQLRDHDCDDRDFTALGRDLVAALAGTGVPLIVNDRAHLVHPIGADGLHVGQHDLDVTAARALIGPHRHLGLSIQHPDQVRRVRHLRTVIDYLGVGPVWTQSTKPDAAPACGPEGLARIVARSPWPCVAIGGVTAAQIPMARASGARGIAVVSAICGRPDPEAATRELRTAWDHAARGPRR
jgi:thiamine-phosphate pyrophosphorylase